MAGVDTGPWRNAGDQGGAAVTYDGDMVDIAHEETARAMLAMARGDGRGRGLSLSLIFRSGGKSDQTN